MPTTSGVSSIQITTWPSSRPSAALSTPSAQPSQLFSPNNCPPRSTIASVSASSSRPMPSTARNRSSQKRSTQSCSATITTIQAAISHGAAVGQCEPTSKTSATAANTPGTMQESVAFSHDALPR